MEQSYIYICFLIIYMLEEFCAMIVLKKSQNQM